MSNELAMADEWVPASCTLPTAEQPLRVEEFDALFREDVLTVTREPGAPIKIALRPQPEVAARAAALAARETGCCSFFTFDLAITDGRVGLTISAAATHEEVLAALADRASALVGPSA